jgi:hypothetical protein
MTEDSTQPRSLKHELIYVRLLACAAALAIAWYLPSNLRVSWPLCRKVANKSQCIIYHTRGEFLVVIRISSAGRNLRNTSSSQPHTEENGVLISTKRTRAGRSNETNIRNRFSDFAVRATTCISLFSLQSSAPESSPLPIARTV